MGNQVRSHHIGENIEQNSETSDTKTIIPLQLIWCLKVQFSYQKENCEVEIRRIDDIPSSGVLKVSRG